MEVILDRLYRLKDGAKPLLGRADYGTDNLRLIAFDTDDLSFVVQPDGFSEQAKFWARAEDLEEMK